MGLTLAQKREAEAREKAEREMGNSVLYMTERSWAKSFPEGHEFLGWRPCEDGGWGIDMGGKNFCAVHVFNTDSYAGPGDTTFFWGDDPLDTHENSRANPWVLMFYGIDNTSFFSRHATKEDAIASFNNTHVAKREHLMFYNS